MAALTYGTNVVSQWFNASADKTALYAYKNASTGDTINVEPDFILVTMAIIIDVRAAVAEECAISGTTLTFPAGLSAGCGWLLVWGE